MLKFLADEDLHGSIITGLRRKVTALDLVRCVDVGLSGKTDIEVLEYAAKEDRMLITQDVSTMHIAAADMIHRGIDFPGILVVTKKAGIGQAILDLELIAVAGLANEFVNRIHHLPL